VIRPHALLLVSLLIFCAGGCTSGVSISSWQHQLERYVRDDGHGDPAVLRDMTLDDTRRGFAIIGDEDPRKGTDAKGLLLAHRPINGRPWFIYLVGLVKDQKVDEIRLAALSVNHGKFDWVLSQKNPHSTQMYRNYNEGLGKKRSPGQKNAPPDYEGFPRAEDVFDLGINGNNVDAVHQGSGAWWQVTIPAAAVSRK